MPVVRFLRNLFGHTITGNPANVINDNYQVYGEVRVELEPGTDIFTKTAGYLMDPAEDATAFFVINSAFKGYFLDPDFNPWPINTISKVGYNILRGKLYGGEFYGVVPEVVGEPTLVEDYIVLKASTPHSIGFSAAYAKLTTDKTFLSHHPLTKVISATQPELLHFLVTDAVTVTVNLKVKLFFTDLTDTTVTPLTLGSISQFDLLRVPVGITSLDLAAVSPSKTISHYEVWLENQATTKISESRFYEIDQYEYLNERFWMYENSFGMPEVFRTIGRAAYKNNISTTVSKRMVTYDYNVKEPSFRINRTPNRSMTEVSTGYLRDQQTADYMVDFLTQKGVLYELKSNDYTPYQLQSPTSHEVRTDDDFSYYVRFQVLGGFENE